MPYPNLEAELARVGLERRDIAECIGRDKSTVSIIMTGKGKGFTVAQSQSIRDRFFPGMSLDYLFSDKPILPNC